METYVSGEDPRAQAATKKSAKQAQNPWMWSTIVAICVLLVVSFVAMKLHHQPTANPASSGSAPYGSTGNGSGNSNGPSLHNVGGAPPTDCTAANGCASQGSGSGNYSN